jgi:AcrR family transcriptional regulator
MEESTGHRRTRPYRSLLRREQAAATHARLLRSARNAFATRGYPGATIEDIAADAGVSVPAVYWIFGNKQKLLRAVLESVGREAGLEARIREILGARKPCLQMERIAELSRRLWEASGALLRGVERARGTDPVFDAWFQAMDEERLGGQRPVIVQLEARGALRAGLTSAEATDLLFVLSGPGLYGQLVDYRGWTPLAYESWLARHLQETLLSSRLRCRAAPGSDRLPHSE